MTEHIIIHLSFFKIFCTATDDHCSELTSTLQVHNFSRVIEAKLKRKMLQQRKNYLYEHS